MAPSSVFKKGSLALITGGASGIGLALTRKCAGHGMDVLIVDNNSYNLSSTKTALSSSGSTGKVETVEMDVSKISDWEELKTKVTKDFGTQTQSFCTCSLLAPGEEVERVQLIALFHHRQS